uniref:G_PROTEIN_RECEP_F2_4 domain-containing protein n=1 Tax=Panagrellus redivivus TaxID=6233 RepID=A0A7E4VE97_PANRE
MKIIRIWILIGCVWTVCFGKEFDRISETSKNFRASHFECKSKKWYCQRECRLQFFEASGSCRKPRADEHCFGSPITYNYTWNHAVTHFPQEYELFKRFPSCWSVLGPLLCSSMYRPCSKNEFYEAGKPNPGILELWQVFPKSVCETAQKACPFVVEAGLWPSFLNCEDTVLLKDKEPRAVSFEEKQKVFSPVEDCKYFGEGPTFPLNQCLWPLVAGPDDLKRTSLHRADPVMDSCFMPCETPLTGFDWVLEHFRFRNSLIAGLTGAVFLLITIYLIAFSKIYSSSLSIFCLGQAFLCATGYLAVWVLSGSEGFRNVGMCIDNGRIRRSPKIFRHLLDSCALETLFLTCSIISGYLWIFSIFMLRILRPRIRNDNYFTFGQRGNEYSARLWLAGIVYLTPVAIVGVVAVLFWNELPIDAFSGLCHIAAGSTRHSMVYYGTVITAMIIVIITCAVVAVQIALQKYRLHNSLRRRDLPRNRSQQRRQPPLIASIEDGGDSETTPHEAEGPQKLTPEMVYAREHGLGEGLISDIWLGAIFASIALSFGIGVFLQYGVLQGSVGTAWERQRVADSVKCSLSSITTTPPFWWNRTLHHDDITREADPFVRKAQLFNAATAPGCNMSVVGDPQLIGLFLTAIILPSLPFWILSVCFLAGFCGHGLLSVRKVRRNLNPFIRDEKREVKLDPFLNAEEQPLPPKENIELESVAATAISAPARLQVEKEEDATTHTIPTIEESVHVGSASVQSAPTVSREPRRLDLNKKRLEHRRDKKHYLEHMKTQSRLFSIDTIPGTSFASIPSAYTALTPPSTSDLTSASQQIPFMFPVPTADPMLVKYIDELKSSQMQQALQINSLAKAVVDGFSKFDEFTEVIAKQNTAPQVSSDSDNTSTTSPPISSRNMRHQRRKRANEKQNPAGRAIPRRSPDKLEDLAPPVPNDSEEDDFEEDGIQFEDDFEELVHEEWMLPNPPVIKIDLWGQLQDQFDEDYQPAYAEVGDIMNNVLLRLIEHCVEFLPLWLHRHFREMTMAEYDDLYHNDQDKFEVFKLLGRFSDSEAVEAAADEGLHSYLMPLAVKAAVWVCDQCHIDDHIFGSRQSAWFNTGVELEKLKEMFVNPEKAIHDAYTQILSQYSDASSISTVDRDVEMADLFVRSAGSKRGPLGSSNRRNDFSSSGGSIDSTASQEVKRRRIDDVAQIGPMPPMQVFPFDNDGTKENVAPGPSEAEKTTAVVRPMIPESVPFRELTPMPADAKPEYFVQINAAYVSSMILKGWVHPPMARPGYKYLFYIFNFEHPSNPSKIFYEEALMDEKDAYDEDIQRQAMEKAMAIFNDEAGQYGQGLAEEVVDPEEPYLPEPAITFPPNIQYFLDKLAATEDGQAAFTLEEMFPDATVRAAMTEAQIAIAKEPGYQAVYVQSLISCHVKSVMLPYQLAADQDEVVPAPVPIVPAVPAPSRPPVDLEALVQERIDEVPEEEDAEADL